MAKRSRPGSRSDGDAAYNLYRKLMAEKKGVLPKGFAEQIENDLTGAGRLAISRRMALAYLERPYRELVKQVRADRDLAIAVASVAGTLKSHIESYRALVGWLVNAETRMQITLCVRRDMADVIAEGKKSNEYAASAAGRREFAARIARMQGIAKPQLVGDNDAEGK